MPKRLRRLANTPERSNKLFRIHFDPATSCFIVQMLAWGFFWRTCCDGSAAVRQTFDTYAQAQEWVKSIGLDKAYREQVPYSQNQLVLGHGAR